jgi:hypothetical protein
MMYVLLKNIPFEAEVIQENGHYFQKQGLLKQTRPFVRCIGSTKLTLQLLETIFLDGKVAPPHEDVA